MTTHEPELVEAVAEVLWQHSNDEWSWGWEYHCRVARAVLDAIATSPQLEAHLEALKAAGGTIMRPMSAEEEATDQW